MLRSILGIDQSAGRTEAGEHLQSRVAQIDAGFEPYLPLLALPIDAEVPMTPEMERLAPEFQSRLLSEVVSRLLTATLTGPTILNFEDAGFMDDTSAELFSHAFTTVDRKPWLVVTSRREPNTGLHSGRGFGATTVELGPLGDRVMLDLAHQICEPSPIPADELSELVGRTGGNPLYLVELLRARMDAGGQAILPSTLEGIVASRSRPATRCRPTDPAPPCSSRRPVSARDGCCSPLRSGPRGPPPRRLAASG